MRFWKDRHGHGSTFVTSRLIVERWHEIIGDPTLADAILDRLVHNSHRLILKGESLRKAAATRQKLDAEPDKWTDDNAGTREWSRRVLGSSDSLADLIGMGGLP